MNTLYAFFEIFGLVHITTQGGPGQATNLLVFNLYKDGFIGMDTGFASAQSIVLLCLWRR
jgi:sn-glycerol 3-phosphate transport system permease protein